MEIKDMEDFQLQSNVSEMGLPLGWPLCIKSKSLLKRNMTERTIKQKYNDGEGLEIIFYDNGKIIGKACTVSYKGKPNNFLHSLEVREEYRGQGYGSAIVKYMIEKYDVQYLYVSKSNEIAINLYKKFGFKEVDDFGQYFLMFREAFSKKL